MEIEHYITEEAKAELCKLWVENKFGERRLFSQRSIYVAKSIWKQLGIPETLNLSRNDVCSIVLRLEFDLPIEEIVKYYQLGETINQLYTKLKEAGHLKEIENSIQVIHVLDGKIQTIH